MPGASQTQSFRKFGDVESTRDAVYGNSLAAVQSMPPVENSRYKLSIGDVGYAGKPSFSLGDHKNALLTGRSMGRRMVGTLTLTDKASGGVVDTRRMAIANIPYMTNQSTFVVDGSALAASHQLRLLPGMYARKKSNGETEVHCLDYQARIWTEDGMEMIGSLVNQRKAVRVWSYDFETRTLVLRPITNWFKNPVKSTMGCARFKMNGRITATHGASHTTTLWATPEHNVYAADGTKAPISTVSKVTLVVERPTQTQIQLVYGSLLGDAHVNDSGSFVESHARDQQGYLEHKQRVLGAFTTKELRVRPKREETHQDSLWLTTVAAHFLYEARELCYPGGVKRLSQAWLDLLDERALAYWFGDDGSSTLVGNQKHKVTACRTVILATDGFSKACISLLRAWLKSKWNLKTTVTRNSKVYGDRDLGWQIRISGDAGEKFLDLIAPYLHACLRYKLGDRPPVKACVTCGREVNRKRKNCNTCCLAGYVAGDPASTARHRFGSVAKVEAILASGCVPPEDSRGELWDARQKAFGSRCVSLESDNVVTYSLEETSVDYQTHRGLQKEEQTTAFDIEVEGTHNYFANGVLVSNCNLLPGTGVSHRVSLDPATGVFKTTVAQSEIPTIGLLKALGATDDELKQAWGPDLFRINQKADRPHHLQKYWEKFGPPGPPPDGADLRQLIADRVGKYPLDPWVSKRTLGKPYDKYGKDPLLVGTKKLLDIAHGRAEPDDRDNPMFSSVWGPEHLIAERLSRSTPILSKALWQATNVGHLRRLNPGILSPAVRAFFTKSGLALVPEGVSAAEHLDHGARITKVGEGGIGKSADSVPMSARNLSSGQFPFIDPTRMSESESVGLDLRVAFGTRLGSDKKIYAPLKDARTGKIIFKSPQDTADSVVAFPGEMGSKAPIVRVIKHGKLTYAPREEVDYVVPTMEQSFSPLTNLVPLKSASKAHRSSMGARMITQSLGLQNPEAPLVRTQVPNQPGKSFEELYGRHMGALFSPKPGVVESVTPDAITVRHADGTKTTQECYNEHPSGRKSGFSTYPLVKPGQQVGQNQVLARSNYTDDKGHAAYGANLRVAFMNDRGNTYEDALTLSQSAAKRMTSEHLYKHTVGTDEHTMVGKAPHVAAFGGKHTLEVLKSIGDDGLAKPGTVVNQGDPLILAVRRKPGVFGRLSRGGKAGISDASETWDYHEPGVVTDAVQGSNGPVVVVKTFKPMKPGDKLCYDPATELLTLRGWKPVYAVTPLDQVASLNPDTGQIEYLAPEAVHTYHHEGRMYALKSTQVDLLVTENHNLYAARRHHKNGYTGGYELIEAKDLYGKRYRMRRDGDWVGQTPMPVVFPSFTVPAGQFGRGTRDLPAFEMSAKTYAMMLGMFVSEGHLVHEESSGTYGIALTQIKFRAEMLEALDADGIKWTRANNDTQVKIYGRQLYEHFRVLGEKAPNKALPDDVMGWDREHLRILFKWMVWGDGSVDPADPIGHVIAYHTTSVRLADQVQQIALHLGKSANIALVPAHWAKIKGKPYWHKDKYTVSIYNTKNRPEINHSHIKKQKAFSEAWAPYVGNVFCVTLPRNHVLYVRRNGTPVWCGNSGRHGNKGIVVIKPDHEMPHDAEGKPIDLIISSLGTISRANPSAIFEAVLGKIAAKRGEPYVVSDFDDAGDDRHLGRWVMDEAKKHGVSPTETLYDPKTGREIPNVMAGTIYAMKLHHIASAKVKGRGLGGYDEYGQPLRGQSGKALRASLGDTNALLSTGATSVLYDHHMNKGLANEEFWQAYMQGFPAPPTKESPAFERFLTELRGAGVDPVRKDGRYHLMALTDKRVQELAGDREVENGETLDFSRNGTPYPGGLFDEKTFGSPESGGRWGKITLHEPMLNPAMEEPARRLLGLTEKKFRDVISGYEELKGKTGPSAIPAALAQIDVQKELTKTRLQAASSRKTARDEANRKLMYLKGLERTGQSPADWVLSAVPVIPPGLRPVRPGGPRGEVIAADANMLYKDLLESNSALKDLSTLSSDVGAERLNLYDAVKAVVGLGDPVGAKNRERGVKGILGKLLGDSSKTSYLQTKLLGTPVNLSGRAQALPNPDLDMDQVGLPKEMAWEIYHPFVVRRLVRQGIPRVDVARMVEERAKPALDALTEEMKTRPVTMTRYPALHRYSSMGFWPVMHGGDGLEVNHIVTKMYGADYDGNCVTYNTNVTIDIDLDAAYSSLAGTNSALANFRSWVMRLTKNESVYIANGRLHTRLAIGEMPRIGTPRKDRNGADVYDLPAGMSVCTYDHETGEARYDPITQLTVEQDAPCVLVKTRHGFEVEVSGNESLAVFDPETGGISRCAPADAIGKFIPRINELPAGGNDSSFDEGWWYGALAADGWVADRMVGYAKNDVLRRSEFVRIAGELFGETSFVAHEYVDKVAAKNKPGRKPRAATGDAVAVVEKTTVKKFGDSVKVHLNGTRMAEQVHNVYGPEPFTGCRGALRKQLPREILDGGSREALLGLFCGLLDGDRSVGWNTVTKTKRAVIKFNTSSPHLRDDIVRLGLRLGVRMAVTTNPGDDTRNTSYVVCPSVVDVHRLIPELRVVAEDTKAVFAELGARPRPKDDHDLIPVTPALMLRLRSEYLRNDMTLYSVVVHAGACGYVTRMSGMKLLAKPVDHPHWAGFERMVRADKIGWEKVETTTATGRQEVFDLTVPTTKVFATGSGLVVYDTYTVHVPLSDNAVDEVKQKMLPSKNLYSPATMKATTYVPTAEYQQGLHAASTMDDPNAETHTFATRAEAVAAAKNLPLTAKIRILAEEAGK